MSEGFSNVQIQANFVAALDDDGNVVQTWWSFTPDRAELAYTGPAGKSAKPDKLSWKLNAVKIDGSHLSGAAFAEEEGIHVDWSYPQPVRGSGGSMYSMDVTNLNTSGDPDGPYDFTAQVTYKGTIYKSPDPDVELESRPG